MRWTATFILILSWHSLAVAGVVNVEFKFTPYRGHPIKNDTVESVPGKARVFINHVMLAEQEVRQESLPVSFDEREIALCVWVEAAGLGSRIRKGKNTIRVEFEPALHKDAYKARLAWASVMDQSIKQVQPGRYRETNESSRGSDTRTALGNVVFEREFTAEFAADLPRHHYPPVASLTNEDKQRLKDLVNNPVKTFRPDFSGVYRLLEGKTGIAVEEVRKTMCVDKAYAAGIRISAPAQDQYEFVTTGNPEVVVQRKGGELFTSQNKEGLEGMDDDLHMCAAVALFTAYPPKLTAVRSLSGTWDVAY
ncbi:MAG TPA: hypothetical protein DCR97_10965 [Deltaproteobacteria bacterium]|nr:hypothetical protein [Deltaproteobacteria bacterium]